MTDGHRWMVQDDVVAPAPAHPSATRRQWPGRACHQAARHRQGQGGLRLHQPGASASNVVPGREPDYGPLVKTSLGQRKISRDEATAHHKR